MSRLPCVLCLLVCLGGVSAADPEPTPPNIVLILSDDQNWSGTAVRMDPDQPASFDSRLRTPSLSRLATEGMRFTRAYAPSPVCSPTRASIQTGLGPAALHWTRAGPSARAADGYALVPPRSERDLATKHVTIAEVLGKAGYATAHLGKWHLGRGGPETHGYDESDGATGNEDAARFADDNPVDVFGMSRRAAAFMKTAKDAGQPFFIQLSSYALHYPEKALAETVAKYRRAMPTAPDRQIYRAALTENLDTGVGILLDAIEGLGLTGNTYVIFMSDNGGGGGGRGSRRGRKTSGALRGGKGALYEGGIRVPFIVRGPGVPPGGVCRIPISGVDLFPTFAALAGVDDEVPDAVEGGDIRALLRGETTPVKRSREGLFFHFPHYQNDTPQAAIVDGDWKLIYAFETSRSSLFDLGKDPSEGRDLAASEAKRAAALEKRLLAYLSEVEARLPTPNPDADPERAAEARRRNRRPPR